MNLNHKLGIGSVQFGTSYGISNTGGQTSKSEVCKILNLALDQGIHVIDTAEAYGNSEKILGENNLLPFRLVSKFSYADQNGSIMAKFNQTLLNLRVHNLYGYIAHRPMEMLINKTIWPELQRLKESGKVCKIGFSLNEPEELTNLLKVGIVPDLIQVPFNYFDERFKDLILKIRSEGCEIHTRSTFLQGLFLSETKKLPAFFDPVKLIIDDLQLKYNGYLSQLLLKYVISLDFIDHVIVGVENSQQLVMNLGYNNIERELPQHYFEITESILMPIRWPSKN